MKEKEVAPGTCPVCGEGNLEWGKNEATTDNDGMNYPFTCNDCGTEGTEHYNLRYHITVYDDHTTEHLTNSSVEKARKEAQRTQPS